MLIFKNWFTLNNLFLFLSIGLTLVSLNAGFFIYVSLFGLTTAILISSVFEILRLSTLYSINKFTGIYKILSLFLYILLAIICFFSAVISFDTQILIKHNIQHIDVEKEMSKDLYLIKQEYSKKYDIKLLEIRKHKDLMEQKLAANPKSTYYFERIRQDEEELDKIIKDREEFIGNINTTSKNKEWIATQKAILGIEEINGIYNSDLLPFQQAASSLLNIDVVMLQKLVGYSLGFAVEAGIIILALLGFNIKNTHIKLLKSESQKNIEEPKNINNIEESKNINISDNLNIEKNKTVQIKKRKLFKEKDSFSQIFGD